MSLCEVMIVNYSRYYARAVTVVARIYAGWGRRGTGSRGKRRHRTDVPPTATITDRIDPDGIDTDEGNRTTNRPGRLVR